MNRFLPFLFSFAISQALIAEDSGDKNPSISLFAESTHLSRAKFKHPNNRGHLSFSETRAQGMYTYDLDDKNGLTVGAGYLGANFHFSKDPKFKQKQFNNALFTVGGFTKDIEKWLWNGYLTMQMNTDNFSLSNYTFFNGLLHGTYQWHDKRNLHVGVLAYTGLRYSRMLPILGMDYTHSEKWKFNLVFPLNMTAIYSFNKQWSVDAGIRYFLTRQRLGKDEHKLRDGFVAYRGWGAEMGLNYQFNDRIRLNAYVGESLSGRMRTSTHNDKHRHHYRVGAAPYFGISATVAF